MNSNPSKDHGEVVRAPRIHRIWAWIFPVLAAGAGLWLLWSNWSSQGPLISIHFKEAPGIQVGKTQLIFRGVSSGKVTGVTLDPDSKGVQVQVRLAASAEHLATSGTDFWIDQPVISITETTGLDAIIQGNSIQARLGEGGVPAFHFEGLAQAPLTPLDNPSLIIFLRAQEISFVGRGTPVYHRGVPVGFVADKAFDESGIPTLRVMIDEKHTHLVLANSRFWIVPAAGLNLSARGADFEVASLAALVQGAIAFDQFSDGGTPVDDLAVFDLAANAFAAKADGPEIEITFEDGRGLVAGETRVVCLGQPIGLIDRVELDAGAKRVRVFARLQSAYTSLATEGAKFSIVHPEVSLEGVSGLETIITGPHIALVPGDGAVATQFVGKESDDEEKQGISITLTADTLPTLSEGAPVYHRGLQAGIVTSKSLDGNGKPNLQILIHPEFAAAVRVNSRFWRVPATAVSAGPGVIDVQVQGLAALVQGGLAFDVFESAGPEASPDATFTIFNTEASARAISPPVEITFENGRGLLAGKTQLRYLGIPVGLVDTVSAGKNGVSVVARLNAGYDNLRRQGATFAIVQPKISLKELSGIETIISGVYIECIPGTGDFVQKFTGLSDSQPEILERKGFDIRITTASTSIRPGAQVFYRDVVVGEVTGKALSANADAVILSVRIDQEYRDLIRKNTVFWDGGQVLASLGPLKLRINSATLVAPDGQIAFANPKDPGELVEPGHLFPLSKKAPRLR
jgi:paraquat-inducible protein B